MKIIGLNEYINVSVNQSIGSATVSITCETKHAERYLGRYIEVVLDGQPNLTFIINAINEYGLATGTAQLSGICLQNFALKSYFKAKSSPISSGRDYTGIYYKGFDGDGELKPIRIDTAIKWILRNAQTEINNRVGRSLEIEFRGQTLEDTVQSIEWKGNDINSMVGGYVSGLDDVVMVWENDKIVIKRFDIDIAEVHVKYSDVITPKMGLNLENVITEVEIESVDIVQKSFDTGGLVSGGQTVFELEKMVTSNNAICKFEGGSSGSDNSGSIDEKLGVLKTNIDGDCVYGSDRRKRVRSGNFSNKFGWENKSVMIDDELGRINSAIVTRNRISDQNRLAKSLVKRVSKLEYTGSFVVDRDYRIKVGDVCKLWNLEDNVIVMSISQDCINAVKTVSFGNKSGDTYETIKSRVELEPPRELTEIETFRRLESIAKGLDLTKEQREKLIGNKAEILGKGKHETSATGSVSSAGRASSARGAKTKSEHRKAVDKAKADRIANSKKKQKEKQKAKEAEKQDLKITFTPAGIKSESNQYSNASKAK